MSNRISRSRAPGVTIKDVARLSGVSISTVSRVIRNRDDVSDDTRLKVQTFIKELAYRPSGVARALIGGYSRTIALLVSDITNPFYPQLAKSVEREASAHGYALVICNTEDDPVEAVALFKRLIEQGVDGMIHASVGSEEEEVIALARDAHRIVFANRRPRSREVSYVVADNAKAATLLTSHLADLGHRRIGFIAGPAWASNAAERLEAFLRTAEDRGVEAVVFHGEFAMESGLAAVRAWAATVRPPSAVIGVNDTVALGAISGMIGPGLSLETAVAGFDNVEAAGSQLVGLTTVGARIDEMGKRCVRLLLRQLNGKSNPPRREVLEPVLRVGRTSLPPHPDAHASTLGLHRG